MPIPDQIKFGLRKYRNLIIAITLLIVLIIGGVMALTGWLGNLIDWHDINGLKGNINAVNENNNLIRANLQNLSIQNAIKEEEVNRLGQDYNRAKTETNLSKEEVRNAERALNAVRNHNYQNTNLIDAQKARCGFNPNAPGCPR